MKLIKILVTSNEEAEAISNVLSNAEEEGQLDFAFGMRITEDLTPSQAIHNLHNEED